MEITNNNIKKINTINDRRKKKSIFKNQIYHPISYEYALDLNID